MACSPRVSGLFKNQTRMLGGEVIDTEAPGGGRPGRTVWLRTDEGTETAVNDRFLNYVDFRKGHRLYLLAHRKGTLIGLYNQTTDRFAVNLKFINNPRGTAIALAATLALGLTPLANLLIFPVVLGLNWIEGFARPKPGRLRRTSAAFAFLCLTYAFNALAFPFFMASPPAQGWPVLLAANALYVAGGALWVLSLAKSDRLMRSAFVATIKRLRRNPA